MSRNTGKAKPVKLRAFRHSLPMELLKAREAAMSRFRPMLRRHGLTEQQWRVIRALSEFGRIDASELAKRSFLLPPSLTRILQVLENDRRLVKRSPDEGDQRRSFLVLTAKGKRLFDKIAPDSEGIYAEIERAYGTQRMSDLYTLLAGFYTALGASDPE